ncbi:MAG TPA: amidohydrolase family protein [Terriglobales bacterium]|nr:amidohydrolase family protein [Terriglobales bacterium]
MPKLGKTIGIALLAAGAWWAQGRGGANVLQQYISVNAPVVALEHVTVIDGTGAAARRDQTVILAQGRIQAIAPANAARVPPDAKVMDMTGDSVFPGLVGMHDHMFYPAPSGGARAPGTPALYNEMGFSFPRLYLAGGVTTLRTTGSVMPYTDLGLKKAIDAGRMIGPHIYVTGPYLEGVGAYTPNMHELTGPDDATRTVNYWAAEGVTSFKAYMHITHDELAAAIQAAHAHGLKITGHLCSIGFREAADLGIDDLEHGIEVDTEFDTGKQENACPAGQQTSETLAHLDLNSSAFKAMIADLVRHHVAVTSTLPVFEISVPGRPPLQPRVLDALSAPARTDYLMGRDRIAKGKGAQTEIFEKEKQFERAFVAAGGTLLAGLDPTGYGGVLAGYGDQREVELLVEAGFTPLEALHIATENGANFLGIGDHIGTLAAGKAADVVVVKGDPSQHIADIENVQIVFKDGVGYDSAKLAASVAGAVGLH